MLGDAGWPTNFARLLHQFLLQLPVHATKSRMSMNFNLPAGCAPLMDMLGAVQEPADVQRAGAFQSWNDDDEYVSM